MFYGDTSQVIVADTITHGVAFDISFTTFAGGCILGIAHDDVRVVGSAIEVRPYDRNSSAQYCTAELILLRHTVSVRLDAPGSFTIHLIGQQRGGTTGNGNEAAEITRSITVR